MRQALRWYWCLWPLLLARGLPSEAADLVNQSKVKAAFIYNFAAFTTWPAALELRPHVTLCLESRVDQALQKALRTLDGKPVRARKLRVLSLGAAVDAGACDALVLGVDGLAIDPALRAAIAGKSVLTICDCASGSPGGEIIRLVDGGRRVAFVIDGKSATAARLVISSKLLRLSRSP